MNGICFATGNTALLGVERDAHTGLRWTQSCSWGKEFGIGEKQSERNAAAGKTKHGGRTPGGIYACSAALGRLRSDRRRAVALARQAGE